MARLSDMKLSTVEQCRELVAGNENRPFDVNDEFQCKCFNAQQLTITSKKVAPSHDSWGTTFHGSHWVVAPMFQWRFYTLFII